GGAEPAGSTAQRSPGGGQQPVPVAVALDHSHHLRGAGDLRQPGHVRTDRIQVDDGACRVVGHSPSVPGVRCREGCGTSIYQPVRDERIRLLSVPRLSTYTTACAGDLKAAIDVVEVMAAATGFVESAWSA